MKKFMILLLVSILFSSIASSAIGETPENCNDPTKEVSHCNTTAYNWYCKRTTDNSQPALDPMFSFIDEYDAYYIDNKNCDYTSDDKVIYLTFDAGYENGNIEKILDLLKEKKVTGAFFILENLVKRNPLLIKRMADEGHLICNHTASHKDMTKVTDISNFKCELDKLESVCMEETGVSVSKYYRPPEGRFSEMNLSYADELGYKTIFWSFAYADWDNNAQMSEKDAIEKVLNGTHNGEVILLHPTSATNAAILDDLIDAWKKDGFTFGTLDELTKN